MKQQLEVPDTRFENPEFVKEYAAKHLKMSVNFANRIAAMLSARNFKQARILDAGCGSGDTIIELAKKFPSCDLYGIDLSDPLFIIANDKKQKEKLADRVKFLKADVQNIQFPHNYFDLVININMLHLIKEPLNMLNEINKVLKSDGLFFITDLRRSILGYLEKEIKSAYTFNEVKEIIAKSNLTKGKFSADMIWWRYQNL